MLAARRDIIDKLKQDVLRLERFKPLATDAKEAEDIRAITASFPNHRFPTGGRTHRWQELLTQSH
ncbi:MAG TPA: hypothetical protein VN721_06665 [Flavipsychrobacter sp.]|nr:hypothetical protein [Flavipsychrobacter sp.]